MSDLTLYSMPSSGNSYKVRLLLSLLGTDYIHVPVEANSPDLQAAKDAGHLPMGRAPSLHLPDGTKLAESNAILWYLGANTAFVPETPLEQAQMLSWMFFEQNSHEPVIAVRSALLSYPHRAHESSPERLAALLKSGQAVLQTMEDGLAGKDFFCGANPTLADIALYAYTHTAESRGGYDLTPFPKLSAWIDRMGQLPGYKGLFESA